MAPLTARARHLDQGGAAAEPEALSVQLPPEYGEAVDHLRYEAADVVYHLLVVLERYGHLALTSSPPN